MIPLRMGNVQNRQTQKQRADGGCRAGGGAAGSELKGTGCHCNRNVLESVLMTAQHREELMVEMVNIVLYEV